MAVILLDTSYVIALLDSGDPYHRAALREAARIRLAQPSIIVTAVITEIGDGFARQWHRVLDYLLALFADPRTTLVPVSLDLLNHALALRNNCMDKDWGITDCISFVVMQERGISDALSADRHFQQVGFRALLLESS